MELRNIRGLTGTDVTVYDITGCLPGQHLGLPSPSATLVIDLADGLVLGTQSRPTPETFRCCLAGMHLRPVTIHHDGTQRGVQLDLDPRTVRTLFGVPVAELANDSVELSQVDHAVADELYHRLADAAPSARARVAADVLARAADPADAPVDAHEAWRLLARSRGRMRIAELVDRSGWSPRRLTALFVAEFGIGPKQAARLMRFDAARRGLEAGRAAGEVAAACGYADQPHMSREFAELTGHAPGSLIRHRASEFVPDSEHRVA